jgi:DNA-binding PadR family transcriptional regulator
MTHRVEQHLPLSPATLHILLALAGEDLHGYGIMQSVSQHSGGRYRIGPGTLYDSLERLAVQGIVTEVNSGAPDADSRRRYYRLTSLGRRVLLAELDRLEAVVGWARLQLGSAKGRV